MQFSLESDIQESIRESQRGQEFDDVTPECPIGRFGWNDGSKVDSAYFSGRDAV